jgi:hypothetical protein
MRKPGCIEPVWFFVNAQDPAHPPGYILLVPYTGGGDRCECPTPAGYRLEYADTLPAVDILERKLQQQERDGAIAEGVRESQTFAGIQSQIRDRIYEHIKSSATDEYNREFLRLWLQLSDERKRKKYSQLFLERESYLWARHNDIGNRSASSEEFNPDRIDVKT